MASKKFNIIAGDTQITGEAQLLDIKSLSLIVTDLNGKGTSYDEACDRAMMRHLLSLEVDGDPTDAIERGRAKCPDIAAQIINLLGEQSGLPWTKPAMKAVDALDANTPPMVLLAAGLTREKADELLSLYPKPQRLIRITDKARKTIWACVVRTPENEEMSILKRARADHRGIPDALLSLTRACVTWSRDPIEGAIAMFPAIPLLSLSDDFDDLGVVEVHARFL
jgi:hypothetical protein